MKKEPRPFSFADNLKVFMIVLLILPVLGIIMSIVFSSGGEIKTVSSDIVSADEETGFNLSDMISFAKAGGGKVEEDLIITMNIVTGNPSDSAVLYPLGLVEDEKYYLFFPFWDYNREFFVGIRVMVFDLDYKVFTGDEAVLNFLVTPTDKALAALGDNDIPALFKFSLKKTDDFYLNYNYSLKELYYGYTGRVPVYKISAFDFNFKEDYKTERLKNNLFTSCSVFYKENKVIPENFMTIRSATNPYIYENAIITTTSPDRLTMFTDMAVDGEDIELGAKFSLKFGDTFVNFERFDFEIFSVVSVIDAYDPYVNLRIVYKESMPQNYQEE